MNIVALVGAIIALLAAVFGALLLVVQEFVEVFLPLAPDGELSCRIAYLGVYEAGFDPSCLDPEDAAASSLDQIDPFTSDTTDFKLLFPAQTNFIKEANPLYALALSNGQTEDALAAFFPDFEGDCAAYYSALDDGQNSFWTFSKDGLPGSSIDALIFESLAAQPAALLTTLFTIEAGVGSSLVNGPISIMSGLVSIAMDEASITEPFDGSDATLLAGTMGAFAVNAPFNTSSIGPALAATASEIVSTCGVVNVSDTVQSCLFSTLLSGDSEYTGRWSAFGNVDDYIIDDAADFDILCAIVGLTAPCGIKDYFLEGQVFSAAVASFAASNSDVATQTVATTLAQGLGGILLILAHVPSLESEEAGSGGETIFNTAVSTIADYDGLTFLTDEYLLCTLLFELGFLDDPSPGVCSFSFFVVPIDEETPSRAYTLAFDGLISGGATAEQAEVALANLGVFSGLFGLCLIALGTQAGSPVAVQPDECFTQFFPAYILSATFTFALDTVTTPIDELYVEAAALCEDDSKDADAIELAQTLGPLGVAVYGVAGIAGLFAATTEKTALKAIAAGTTALGAIVILSALLKVYNAPVYSAVGGDPVVNTPQYEGGVSVTYGLLAIACGVIGSVLLLVSIKCGDKGDGEDLDKTMKTPSV